jgi:dihydrofolate reductase
VRKLVAATFVGLDGVMEAPDKWHFPYVNDEMMQDQAATMADTGTILLGRITYQEFARFWPGRTSADFGPLADFMNRTPKLVVSTTLAGTPEWENSSLITGDVVQRLRTLKEQPGKSITILGSASLVRSVLRAGLLDELHILLDPVIVGTGKRLLQDMEMHIPLRLTASKALSTGVLSLTYAPAPAEDEKERER